MTYLQDSEQTGGALARARITLADLIAAGEIDPRAGYAPNGLTAGVDAEVAAEADCEVCGHHGLSFRGYGRPGAWRGFAICGQCGHCEEF